MSPGEWLDLIEARAVRLRNVGVLEATIDGNTFKLTAADPPAPPAANAGPTGPEPDPLRNPALYVDGVVPGYTLAPDGEA